MAPMTFKPEDEVRSHFAGFAHVLDLALEEARPSLAADGVTVYDHSNRTGFDKSGMGNPTWEYEFERRQEAGSFVALGTQSRRQHHAANHYSDSVICDHGLSHRGGGTENQSELQHGTPLARRGEESRERSLALRPAAGDVRKAV